MNVLIIGGVAAGTKAAAKIKRLSPDAQVTILTKGRDISYAGCGLPYYVGGLIEHKEELIVNTPAKFTALTGANVLVEREVTALLPQSREAVAKNLRTGAEERYSFDECIIASGASSIIPPLPGVSLPGVFTIRTPQDAIDLREYLEQNNAKRAVVAGGGFIGLEMAENLMEQGLSVTVIDMAEQIMPGFDPEMAELAKNHLEKQGIKVRLNTRLEAVTGTTQAQGVQVAGEELKADVVVLSLGIRPNTAFLKESGIRLLPNGTIAVDAQLRTNLPHIYAAGDCVTVKNRLTGEDTWSPMGSSANMEGRTLAQVLCGEEASYPGVLGTAVVKLPHKFKSAVGGCPNNCVKPNLNDLGVVGQRIPGFQADICRGCKVCQVENTCPVHAAKVVDGVLKIDPNLCNNCGRCIGTCPFKAMPTGEYGYRIYIGGRWGKKYAHGKPLDPVFTSEEEVMQVIEKAILLFREQGKTGERFSDTIERLGFENVQSQLLGSELLERKDQIIGAKLHLVGGATC